jgi:hypothetical protein
MPLFRFLVAIFGLAKVAEKENGAQPLLHPIFQK